MIGKGCCHLSVEVQEVCIEFFVPVVKEVILPRLANGDNLIVDREK